MRPALGKARTKRRILKRTPGGKIATHFERKPHSKARCALCKNFLSSVPTGIRKTIKNLKITKRRPTRPYAGNLCSACTKRVISVKSKLKNKLIKPEDVPLSLKSYVKIGDKK